MKERRLPLNATDKLLQKQNQKKSEKFIKGPIQMAWLTEACKLTKSAMKVALAICFLRGIYGDTWFRLGSTTTKKFSIDRQAKSRGLKELEQVGLIVIKQKQGAIPQIKMLNVCRSAYVHDQTERPSA